MNIQAQEYLSLNNWTFLTFFVYDSASAFTFFNHILVFFVALFEFSLKFLTSVYRVTVNHFGMGGDNFVGHL